MIKDLMKYNLTVGLLVVLAITLFASFYTPYAKFEYVGSNALYIQVGDSLHIRWITASKDVGTAEIKDSDGKLLQKIETDSSKVHHAVFFNSYKESMLLRYGGKKGEVFEQKLEMYHALSASEFINVENIYVIGDVHGRYNELIKLLQKSKIIDQELNWIAGESHIVFLGDLFDRGNDVTKVLWFIYNLEEKAKKEHGYVHLVLGNHEIMTMSKDLRYLGPKEAAIASTYQVSYADMYHPTNSLLGSWLTSKPAVLKIDNVIFAHGGIIDLNTKSITDFNVDVNRYLQEPVFIDIMAETPDTLSYSRELWNQRYSFFYSPYSPFWYRGYVQSDTLQVQLNTMLRKYKSKVHVVAHTPLETITKRYKGKLLTTDLNEAATQLLLLKKKGKKFDTFKIDSDGNKRELD